MALPSLQFHIFLGNLHFHLGETSRSNFRILSVSPHRTPNQYLVDCEVLADRAFDGFSARQQFSSRCLLRIFVIDWRFPAAEKTFSMVEAIFPLVAGMSTGTETFFSRHSFFSNFQILRLSLIALHALQLFVWNDCDYPMIYPWVVLINLPVFVILTISNLILDNGERKFQKHFLDE